MDDLHDEWVAQNSIDDRYAEDVAAIRASIEHFKNGERDTIAGEHAARLRREFGVIEQ